MNRVELNSKIDSLFRYRKFPELLKLVNQDYNSSELIENLKSLQVAIYWLDHYLENNWNTESSELDKYWDEINKQLSICGVKEELIDDYGHQIRMYQKHELGMRESIMPYDHDMHFYYFYKSCDVKLLRRIIYDHYPSLEETYALGDWKLFDYITEINDDVEDVFEDCSTINGNSFLLSILQKSSQFAENSFDNFIDDIDRKNRILLIDTDQQELYRWTRQEIIETSDLLRSNLTKINKGYILKSPVLSHLYGQMSMVS